MIGFSFHFYAFVPNKLWNYLHFHSLVSHISFISSNFLINKAQSNIFKILPHILETFFSRCKTQKYHLKIMSSFLRVQNSGLIDSSLVFPKSSPPHSNILVEKIKTENIILENSKEKRWRWLCGGGSGEKPWRKDNCCINLFSLWIERNSMLHSVMFTQCKICR